MSKMKSYIFDLFDDNQFAFKDCTRIQDAEFWSSDKDANLSFKIARQEFNINKATINLYNKSDKTLILDRPMTITNNEARFKMPLDIIKHFGSWSVQVIFNELHTSPTVSFDVFRKLGDNLPEKMGLLHEWENLHDEVKAFVAEIEGFTLEEFVALKMGEELANLETNYATRLTGLERKDTELTAQLAHNALFVDNFTGNSDIEIFNNAINTMSQGNTLKTLPDRDYAIPSLLIEDKDTIIIDGLGSYIELTDTTKSFKIKDTKRVILRNLKIGMNTSERNYASGIELENVDTFIIENCEIDGSNATGIIAWNCKNGVIRNNKIKNTLADGIHLTRNCENIDVYSNSTENTGDDGIASVSYEHDLKPNKGINIYSNSVLNSSARGITVGGGQDISVFSNTVRNTYVHGIYVACEIDYPLFGFNNIFVFGNKVYGVGEYGTNPSPVHSICVRNDILGNNSSDIIIASNQIFGGTGHGIHAFNVSTLIIAFNIFNGLRIQFGDIYQCSDVEIIHNIFKGIGGAVYNGFNIRNSNNIDMVHNQLINAGQSGIYVIGAAGNLSKDINVSHNKIINPDTSKTTGKDGVQIELAENITVIGNHLKSENDLRSVILIASTCKGSIVVDNNNYSFVGGAAFMIPISMGVQNALKVQKVTKTGIATFSGDGSTRQFNIPHGLPITPKYYQVMPATIEAGNAKINYAAANSNNLVVLFDTIPVSGTDNIKVTWLAEV